MSTTTTLTTVKPAKLHVTSLDGSSLKTYNDWRDDFYRDGYVVLKNVIPRDRAENYRSKALDWITSFNKGLDINDPSTWTQEHLPQSFKTGMYLNYCAAHEKFVWDARQEPGVLDAFQKIWDAEKLVVSFDTINITFPGRKDVDWSPWPHVDQAPERKGLSCVQGIINLSQAGPEDGGLLLMKGSSKFFDEFFALNPPDRTQGIGAKHYDFYPFKEAHVDWYKQQGCELVKVCAEPGDLILWDSRSMHYAAFPDPASNVIRTIIYACFTPASFMLEEDRQKKIEIFKRWETTTHWPHCNLFSHGKAKVNGVLDPDERDEPLEKPELTPKLLRLAGVETYD
ncbi:Synaptic vesicle transporter svop [Pleurostoma richardsiae]|uniref:Synaptic vesicle transporter svop n=1 Tax=Pleurostoma richardsiae TaxID=41990 RepID=A0AA38RSV9_9PEZI|nr:Synaptic vesicle transporter svop [Pleurostoma richardsiae]